MDRIYGNFIGGRGGIGLLLIRLVFGLGLVLHGLQKINSPGGPLHWMGPGAPVPSLFQGLATLSEFGGGLALLVGLLVPLASLGIFFTMAVAIFTAHNPLQGHPFIGKGGFESALGYLTVALLMLFTGPGAYSLDALLFGRSTQRTRRDHKEH